MGKMEHQAVHEPLPLVSLSLLHARELFVQDVVLSSDSWWNPAVLTARKSGSTKNTLSVSETAVSHPLGTTHNQRCAGKSVHGLSCGANWTVWMGTLGVLYLRSM